MPVEPAHDGDRATAGAGRAVLARVFWLCACANIALTLTWIWFFRVDPMPYVALFELFLLGLLIVIGAIAVVAALIRNGVAYGIGLALLALPLMYFIPLSLAALTNAIGRAFY
jgi:hypothetical protein